MQACNDFIISYFLIMYFVYFYFDKLCTGQAGIVYLFTKETRMHKTNYNGYNHGEYKELNF